MSTNGEIEEVPPPPVSVLLLRSPVSVVTGTDPYHDAFGSFCLPSFASSALESGTSTPLSSHGFGGKSSLNSPSSTDHSALDLIKTALTQHHAPPSTLQTSPTGRRKGKFIQDQSRLMTHHLSFPDPDDEDVQIEYCVTSFPILDHKLVNQQQFVDRLTLGCPSKTDSSHYTPYRGVIVTSQRAVEAYTSAGLKAMETMRANGKSSASSPTQWQRVPFFAVGPATAAALRSMPLAPWLRPRQVMGGDATGTGEALARYVIRHFSGPSLVDPIQDKGLEDPSVPRTLTDKDLDMHLSDPQSLLYLVGDKNAPTIQDMLGRVKHPHERIPLDELQVYETSPDAHFAEGCDVLARTLPTVFSRPPSRRPSQGSSYSQSGSRRPSGGNTPVSAPVLSPSVGPLKTDSLTHNGQHQPPSPLLGLSSINTTSLPSNDHTAKPKIGASAASPTFVASPAVLETESINPIEEDNVLGLLRSKIRTGSSSGGSSHPKQPLIARPDWIVFFSPSGVNYALDEFRRRRWLPPAKDKSYNTVEEGQIAIHTVSEIEADKDALPKTTMTAHKSSGSGSSRKYPKIAVLGSSTQAWMIEHLGIHPDAVAPKPGPRELKEAIEAVELRKLRNKAAPS